MKKKLYINDFLNLKQANQKFSMITCYDSTFAKLVDASDIEIILVGDSLGNTMLGYQNTLNVDMNDMIRATASVTRTVKNTFVVADLPYMSYHNGVRNAVENAGRLIKEGGAQAVKLEGGEAFLREIEAIVKAQIPVVSHLGLTPQSFNAHGGYKLQANDADAINLLIRDASLVEEAGASMLVLEGVPAKVAEMVYEDVNIPVVGIGAGDMCDGQVLVLQDMLGMNGDNVPKFVKQYLNLQSLIVEAFNNYNTEVKTGKFPTDKHSFKGNKEAIEEIKKLRSESRFRQSSNRTLFEIFDEDPAF